MELWSTFFSVNVFFLFKVELYNMLGSRPKSLLLAAMCSSSRYLIREFPVLLASYVSHSCEIAGLSKYWHLTPLRQIAIYFQYLVNEMRPTGKQWEGYRRETETYVAETSSTHYTQKHNSTVKYYNNKPYVALLLTFTECFCRQLRWLQMWLLI